MNRQVYRRIAKKHGVSAKEVRQDIQKAINITYTGPNLSLTNRNAQSSVPRKGKIPTPEELIDYIVNETINDKREKGTE